MLTDSNTAGKREEHPEQVLRDASECGRKRVAVVGAGAAGLSAAWLLGKRHDVTLIEGSSWSGGHAHTAWIDETSQSLVDATDAYQAVDDAGQSLAVDTGFIVYNELTYPNFTAWMKSLAVSTQATDMSFAVSRNEGNFEYAGGSLSGLFAQPSNLLRLRFWRMLRDLVRFYREAVETSDSHNELSLGEFLHQRNYSQSFVDDHLLPFGAAIWSTPQEKMLDYPVRSFVSFCDNHGLLKLYGRPQWRTIQHGSASYVKKVTQDIISTGGFVITGNPVRRVLRSGNELTIILGHGEHMTFDHVVLACHADQALGLVEQPSELENELLGVFRYEDNEAVLHTEPAVMPGRRSAWSSWNYVEQTGDDRQAKPGVVYWMNRLQNLSTEQDYFVSLNPQRPIDASKVLRTTSYSHPVFNQSTHKAQQRLWRLQGVHNTWYCGSYFGSGFHEDAIQAGFAVAEQLGGRRRPWQVENESSRIVLPAESSSGIESLTDSSGRTE